MEPSRVIKLISDGTPGGTHIYDSNGTELEGIYEAHLHFSVDRLPKAELKAYQINGEFQAEVASIERQVIPPAKLTESIQLKIGEPTRRFGLRRSPYVLTRFIPLPTWGTRTVILSKGWMKPCGPMTIERMLKSD